MNRANLTPTIDASIGNQLPSADDIELIASHCGARPYIAIEGFMQSGKSTLAEKLAARLQLPLIQLDEFLPEDPDSIDVRSYLAKLDLRSLHDCVTSTPTAIVEGVLLRDVLAGVIRREDLTVIYIARCTRPVSGGSFIWHDGFRIEDFDLDRETSWMLRSETEYHFRVRPHEDSDVTVIRIPREGEV